MKFRVQSEPFQRLLEILSQAPSSHARRFPPLTLEASRGTLRVQLGDLSAEIEAVVWEEGACAVSAVRLRRAVAENLQRPFVSFEQTRGSVRVGDFFLPRLDAHVSENADSSAQMFFAGDFGVVPSLWPEALREVA